MSDNIRVPIEQLREIGTKFKAMKAELDGTEKSATELHGVDDNDGYRVSVAIDVFLDEWRHSRRVLNRNIGALGELSGNIANVTAKFDSEVAGSLHKAAGKMRSRG